MVDQSLVKATPEPVSVSAADDDEDDAMSYFQKLANE